MTRLLALLMLALVLLPTAGGDIGPGSALAQTPVQVGPGGTLDNGRKCQTVRACNFRRDGSYRGCISAYSCRVCSFVETRCTIDGTQRICREARCTWG